MRPAVKEQVESLGAKFVEAAARHGRAPKARAATPRQLDEEFNRSASASCWPTSSPASDVCITTAAIPGKPSPLLVTADAVRGMAPGSVIVDLAAERGGNCELTKADETVVENGVTILGPTNLPSEVPQHASQMYAKNVATLLQLLTKKGEVDIDLKDEVIRETLAAKDGASANPRLREMLELGAAALPPAARDRAPRRVDHSGQIR